MVKVYADNALIYSPNLPGRELLSLKATLKVDKAGTAEFTMPPGHPAFNAFTSYRTLVEIHRRGELLFRGRALYPTDDFRGCRTITCEGERCFLCDSVLPPYLYQTRPDVIFADVIARHNAQVEPFKQFRLGAVTVEDPNGYIRLESEEMESTSDVIDKLVERVGGYITFTTDAQGRRCINWLASLGRQCGQAIEFGENLLDFSRTGANSDLATVLYPYGAKDETTGKRLTIASVNDGREYVQDDEAVALRGRISRPVYYDDITLPANLKRKALQDLALRKLIVTTLELSAVDLSVRNRNIDAFRVGDLVPVRSAPHGVDDLFLLRERSYDFLDPAQDRVVLGMDTATLTGLDVISTKGTLSQLRRVEAAIRADYRIGITDAAAAQAPKVVTAGDMTGQYMTADGLLLQWGRVDMTLEALTEPQLAPVRYAYAYRSQPAVFASAALGDASDVFVGVKTDYMADPRRGMAVAVTLGDRIEPRDVAVYWLAIGRGV